MPSSDNNEAWKKEGRLRNPDSPKQKSLDSRCSPSDLKKLITQIEQDDLKELFLHLASKFDLENNLIKDDVGSIEVNATIVERAIGLPSYGTGFPEYNPDDIHIAVLKLRWGSVSLKDLKAFVTTCRMNSNEERREFRESFILILAKTFLCPTTNQYISPERHLPLVLDVVIFFHRLEWGPLNRHRGLEPCEFEHKNEEDDDQQEREENESLITSPQVETELNKIWAMMVIDEDLLVKAEEEAHRYFASKKKPDIIYAKYNDGPSFSLGFSQEFNTPTPSPDGSASEDTEVLDIPPIREMLPEDIVLHAEQDPSTIRSLKTLTLEQENKIYNWVMNPSKANGIQEETIASFRGYQNFFLSRSEIRFFKA
ncbi:hypothetical protein PIB30_104758 [Stylosanthes scabra]|uniref:Uncharacterized protein n=1 Tax=Stylosanthes scabra TaxID=79078 RepID=A0ABU6T0R6_9FABA|nr:hypothetical protein [Stylosanthes scabra]